MKKKNKLYFGIKEIYVLTNVPFKFHFTNPLS